MDDSGKLLIGSIIAVAVTLSIIFVMGIGLQAAFSYPSVMILGLSIPLAFTANLLCREWIDWGKVEELKENISELEKTLRKGKRKRGKKKKRFEKEEGEYQNLQERMWDASVKQAAFYLAFFVVFSAWLGYVYGNLVVVELPFNLAFLGFQNGEGLNFVGWFSISYFGFAYFWRRLIVPEM